MPKGTRSNHTYPILKDLFPETVYGSLTDYVSRFGGNGATSDRLWDLSRTQLRFRDEKGDFNPNLPVHISRHIISPISLHWKQSDIEEVNDYFQITVQLL